jgi:hypothetical protein|tara:strand:- start:2946 stop:3152 length:207 start_codon:yes stop_codon:yes gene_type:complete
MNKIIFQSFLIYIVSTNNVFAYLDPGTGSIILQAILGAIAAGFSYCVFYWNKVKNFFLRVFKRKKKTD